MAKVETDISRKVGVRIYQAGGRVSVDLTLLKCVDNGVVKLPT
jgi:hypothetical protein